MTPLDIAANHVYQYYSCSLKEITLYQVTDVNYILLHFQNVLQDSSEILSAEYWFIAKRVLWFSTTTP